QTVVVVARVLWSKTVFTVGGEQASILISSSTRSSPLPSSSWLLSNWNIRLLLPALKVIVPLICTQHPHPPKGTAVVVAVPVVKLVGLFLSISFTSMLTGL